MAKGNMTVGNKSTKEHVETMIAAFANRKYNSRVVDEGTIADYLEIKDASNVVSELKKRGVFSKEDVEYGRKIYYIADEFKYKPKSKKK